MFFNPTLIYVIIISIGFFLISLSSFKLTDSFAIWIAVFPLVVGLVAPEGLEKIPPTRVINIAFLIISLLILSSTKIKYRIGKPEKWYLIFFILSVLSALFSEIPVESLMRAFTYLEPFVWLIVGFTIVQISHPARSLKRILIGIFIGFILVCLYSIVEFSFQRNFLIDFGIIDKGVYIDEVRFGISGRLTSSIGQPVYTAIYLLVILIIIYYYIKHVAQQKITKFILYVFMALGFLIIVFTGTRAAYVGILLFPLIFLLLNRNYYKIRKIIPIYFVILLFTLIILPSTFPSYLTESFNIGSYNVSNANVLSRISLTNRMLQIFTLSPIIGFGPGYIQKQFFLYHNYNFSDLIGAENQYSTLLVENGILGFIAFICFIIFVIRALLKPTKHLGYHWFDVYKIFVITILLDVFIISISCSIIRQVPMYYIMLVTGMAIGIQRKLSV